MKKIELAVSQTGNDKVVSQGEISVRVGGKFCKNNIIDIFQAAVCVGKCTSLQVHMGSTAMYQITLRFKSGEEVTMRPDNGTIDNFFVVYSKARLEKNLLNLCAFIKKVEACDFEAHKTTVNYTLIGV